MWRACLLVGAGPLAYAAVYPRHGGQQRLAPLHASCEPQQDNLLAPVPGAKLILAQLVFRCAHLVAHILRAWAHQANCTH